MVDSDWFLPAVILSSSNKEICSRAVLDRRNVLSGYVVEAERQAFPNAKWLPAKRHRELSMGFRFMSLT